jgi:hypothetical protein
VLYGRMTLTEACGVSLELAAWAGGASIGAIEGITRYCILPLFSEVVKLPAVVLQAYGSKNKPIAVKEQTARSPGMIPYL